MPVALLPTKLFIPQGRSRMVHRPRLIEKLNAGLHHKLTLISAPAGFGKTTLLIDWIQSRRESTPPPGTAWVSLEERDNDPVQFLTYVVAALRTLNLPIRESMLEVLRSPQPPPLDLILTSLVSDLTTPAASQDVHSPSILVLDDYHLIRTQEIHDAVAFLLEYLPAPPQGPHLVIASRSDPPLPLARLRGRGLLTELRVSDLRFTEEEAATLLRDVAGLSISAQEIAALETRTEGWITGLQLATIALQTAASATGSDAARFIQEFTGSHRFVLDFLVEEVFSQQPLSIKQFLLQTSILDRLSGALCEAVCYGPGEPCGDGQDGQEVLEALERSNLFIVPLDEIRHWYRYHRLFADLLRSQLKRFGAELGCAPEDELHGRASLWYESQGLLAEAVRHALAAGQPERAANLIEGHALQMLKGGEMTALLGWLDALPTDAILSRPQLCLYQAWGLALSGRLDEVEVCLQAAESSAEVELLDDRLGQIDAIRSYVAAQRHDIPYAVDLARRALSLLDEDNLVVRSVVAFILGNVHLVGGNLARAMNELARASEMGQIAGNIHVAVPAANLLADLKVQQGRLHEAFDAYQRALGMAGTSPVAAQAYSGMGMLLYEWNDLESAARHLARSIELGQLWGNVDALSSDYVALSRVRLAQGDLSESFDILREAARLAESKGTLSTAGARVAASQTRLALVRGDLPAVARWVRDCGLDAGEQINPFREEEHITLARALLGLGQIDAAGDLHDRLLTAFEKGGRPGRSVEILVLQSLAHQARGNRDQALNALARAVVLAEPEGYGRTFLDEGEPLRSLLTELNSGLIEQTRPAGDPESERVLSYLGRLLSLPAAIAPRPSPVRSDQAGRADAGLVERLSERELEVLLLVAAGRTNQAIANQLSIAVSTVKSHTNSIYSKLGVRNRTQAVARAQALGLL